MLHKQHIHQTRQVSNVLKNTYNFCFSVVQKQTHFTRSPTNLFNHDSVIQLILYDIRVKWPPTPTSLSQTLSLFSVMTLTSHSIAEVINHNRLIASLYELHHTMAANVAPSTCDKNLLSHFLD